MHYKIFQLYSKNVSRMYCQKKPELFCDFWLSTEPMVSLETTSSFNVNPNHAFQLLSYQFVWICFILYHHARNILHTHTHPSESADRAWVTSCTSWCLCSQHPILSQGSQFTTALNVCFWKSSITAWTKNRMFVTLQHSVGILRFRCARMIIYGKMICWEMFWRDLLTDLTAESVYISFFPSAVLSLRRNFRNGQSLFRTRIGFVWCELPTRTVF